MNKKLFWLIALIATLCLSLVMAVGCAGGDDGAVVTDNASVTIENKLDLTELWHVGDEDRELETKLSDELKGLQVEIKSENPDVISVVSGNKIHAQGKGETVVTAEVTNGEKTYSDSLEISVNEALQVSITNKATLQTDWDKYEEEYRFVSIYVNNLDECNPNDAELVSSAPEIVKTEGRKLIPLKGGEVEITVSLGGWTDKFSFSVVVNPALVIKPVTKTLYVGQAFEIPEIEKAVNSYDNDMTSQIDVSATEGLALSGDKTTATADSLGRYTITYSFTDEKTSQEISESVTVDVVNQIFKGEEPDDSTPTGAHNPKGNANTSPLLDALLKTSLKENEDGTYSEVVTSTQNALLFGKIKGNEGKLSSYYYAEAMYNIVNGIDVSIGLGHIHKNNKNNYRNWALVSVLNTKSYNYNNASPVFNDKNSENIFIGSNNSRTKPFSFNIFDSRHIAKLSDNSVVKIAIARDGDYFYTFINDQYVNCVTYEDFRNHDTSPAIIGYNMGLNSAATEIHDIVYIYETAEVKAKLDTLLGENKENMIVAYSGKDDANSTSTYQKSFEAGKFSTEINDASGERGLGFNYTGKANFNDSVVSPYIWFDKSFTFQWEYKHTDDAVSFKSSSNSYRFMLEMRNTEYGNEFIQMGSIFRRNDTLKNEFYMNVLGYSGSNGYKTYGEPMNGTGKEGYDDSQGARYSITRLVKEDHSEIIMTATSLADNKTYTRIIQWGGLDESTAVKADNAYKNAQSQWNRPVVLLWHNTCVGEYSNIKWEVLPDNLEASALETYSQPQDGIITTTRLTQDVQVGEEPDVTTQTVNLNEWSFTADGAGKHDIVVDFGESIATGSYDIALCAVGDSLGSAASKDLLSCEVYKITIELQAGQRYVKLSADSLPIGHGRYTVKVEAHATGESETAAELNIANVYVSKTGELYATVKKS